MSRTRVVDEHGERDRRDDRGAAIPLVAMVLTVLIISTAFTVDLGHVMAKRRDLQADTDMIANDLARLLDGRTVLEYESAELTPSSDVHTTLQRTAAANGIDPLLVRDPGAGVDRIRWGRYDSGTDSFVALASNGIASAVEVSASDEVDYFFATAIGLGSGSTQRTSVAAQDALTDFEFGSFLAGSTGTFGGPFLSGLLSNIPGFGNVNVTAVGYQGLANASLPLGLLATQLGFASPEQLVSAGPINAAGFFIAAAQVLDNQGNTAAANVLNAMAAEVDSSAVIDVGGLVNIQQGGPGAAGSASISALGLVSGSAFLLNGSSAVSVPAVTVGLPAGVGSVSFSVTVIERERVIIGARAGQSFPTQQMEVEAIVDLTPLSTAFGTLSGRLTVLAESGGATATVDEIRCDVGLGVTHRIEPTPIDVTGTHDLVLAGPPDVLTATQSANAVATGLPGTADFDFPAEFLPAVGTGTHVRVGSPMLGLAGLLSLNTANVNVLGLPVGMPLADVLTDVNLALDPVLQDLDAFLTGPVAQSLGLSLGGADVGALDQDCLAALIRK